MRKILADKNRSKSDLCKKAEIWDLYSENRECLGKDHIKGVIVIEKAVTGVTAFESLICKAPIIRGSN